MAFDNQVVSSVPDMIGKLNTLLVANGWTKDEPAGSLVDRYAVSKTGADFDIYISMRWNSGSPNNLGLYQALGWLSSTDPGNHTDDSGQGQITSVDATLANGRHVRIGPSPVQYWAFVGDHYCHVVVQETASRFVHFGFGQLDKFGDNWTGGEYCYGQYDVTRSINGSSARGDFLSFLLDGRASWHNNALSGAITEIALKNSLATIHIEGLSGQTSGSKWGVVAGARHPFTGGVEADRGANVRHRVFGGYRDGTSATPFGRYIGRATDGVVPLYQIPIFYSSTTDGNGGSLTDSQGNFSSAGVVQYLGSMKDIRGCAVPFFTPGQELSIGGDVWVVFPMEEKSAYKGSNSGIAYKKVS